MFIYFAKYPDYEGVINNFKLTNASEEYLQFKESVESMDSRSLLPEIKDYVFSVSDAAIKTKIETLRDCFLFVDYGAILSTTNQLNVKDDIMDMAITIARTNNGTGIDPIEELVKVDKMLNLIKRIRNDMRNDSEDSFVKMIQFPADIVPYFSAELYNSYGWTLIFKIKGVNFI